MSTQKNEGVETQHNKNYSIKKIFGSILIFIAVYLLLFGIPLSNGQETNDHPAHLKIKIVKADVNSNAFAVRLFMRQNFRPSLRLPEAISEVPILAGQRIESEWIEFTVETNDGLKETLNYRQAAFEEIQFVSQNGSDCTGNHTATNHRVWSSYTIGGTDDPFLGQPNSGTIYHYVGNSIQPGTTMIEFLRKTSAVEVKFGADYRTGLLSDILPEADFLKRTVERTCRFNKNAIIGFVNAVNDAIFRFETNQCPATEHHTALSCHYD